MNSIGSSDQLFVGAGDVYTGRGFQRQQAQCILAVVGFLPFEEKRKLQSYFFVFSGHVEPIKKYLLFYYII